MPIHFHKADVSFRIPKSTALKRFLVTSFKTQTGKQLSLSCVFCSDEYLLNINRQFLNHDYYTDIITFPLDETPQKTEAELYISINRVKENAQSVGVSFETELHRVIFHGVLHLCGFGDKTPSEQKKMRLLEDNWLNIFTKYC